MNAACFGSDKPGCADTPKQRRRREGVTDAEENEATRFNSTGKMYKALEEGEKIRKGRCRADRKE